jgi:vacuolar-type H+-ATPase subunit I/STV1
MLKKALGFQNKILKTADELEVEFPDLEENDTPTVGDKGVVDGNTSYTGEVVMANGEIYVFESGTLTEIKEAEGEQNQEDDEPIDGQDVEEIKEDLEEIKETLVTIIEEVVPELAKLNKENKRLNSALAKLQGIDPEPKGAKHDRTPKEDKKGPKFDLDKVNVKLK